MWGEGWGELFFLLLFCWVVLLLAGVEVEDSSKVEHRGPTVYRDS